MSDIDFEGTLAEMRDRMSRLEDQVRTYKAVERAYRRREALENAVAAYAKDAVKLVVSPTDWIDINPRDPDADLMECRWKLVSRCKFFRSDGDALDDPYAIRDLVDRGGRSVDVYGLKHGRFVLSRIPFGCKFDSGIAGMAYIDKGTIEDIMSGDEDPYKVLDQELDWFTHYLNGEVYQAVVYDGNWNRVATDHILFGLDWKTGGVAEGIPWEGAEQVSLAALPDDW